MHASCVAIGERPIVVYGLVSRWRCRRRPPRIKGYPALHGEMLSTAVQQQLLGTINWAGVLASSKLAVVVHEHPPEPQDDQGRSAPLVASRPPCYQEFIVHSVLVERAALSSTTVRVMIIAKTWRDQTSPVETHSIMADEKVNLGADDLKGG